MIALSIHYFLFSLIHEEKRHLVVLKTEIKQPASYFNSVMKTVVEIRERNAAVQTLQAQRVLPLKLLETLFYFHNKLIVLSAIRYENNKFILDGISPISLLHPAITDLKKAFSFQAVRLIEFSVIPDSTEKAHFIIEALLRPDLKP